MELNVLPGSLLGRHQSSSSSSIIIIIIIIIITNPIIIIIIGTSPGYHMILSLVGNCFPLQSFSKGSRSVKHIKKTIDKDERYLAVVSSSLREDWFYNYVESLQDSRGRKRRRSRSKERIGIGKKVMYNQGWRSGDGLGKK